MRVALVVGHSLTSKGACNKNASLCEFDYNSRIVTKLHDSLINTIDVVTIYRDEYSKLPDDINNHNPDLILSFHCNAFNEEVSGTEILYYHKSKLGKVLAFDLQQKIANTLNLPNRGVKACCIEDRGGYLLKYTKAPCLIIEPFFIDNDKDLKCALDNEEKLIDSYREFIVRSF
jgi:N-acetylmuramoyl-L-alanine amidase